MTETRAPRKVEIVYDHMKHEGNHFITRRFIGSKTAPDAAETVARVIGDWDPETSGLALTLVELIRLGQAAKDAGWTP